MELQIKITNLLTTVRQGFLEVGCNETLFVTTRFLKSALLSHPMLHIGPGNKKMNQLLPFCSNR